MKFKVFASILICVSSVSVMKGQRVPPAKNAGDPSRAVQTLVDHFAREFTNVAKQMPADKYDFTPSSLAIRGADFEEVRTFADQIRHVTEANYAIAATLTGGNPAVPNATTEKMRNKDAILAGLAESFATLRRAIATINTENQNEIVDDPGVGPKQTRESEAAWAAIHGYDHYGQIAEYLRMNGFVPKP